MAEIDQKRQDDNYNTQLGAADAFQRGKESCHHCDQFLIVLTSTLRRSSIHRQSAGGRIKPDGPWHDENSCRRLYVGIRYERFQKKNKDNKLSTTTANMMLRLALLSLLAAGSTAFMVSPNTVRTHRPVTAQNLIMTEEEITTILGKAHGCVDSECAVDDVDDLIAELKDQQKHANTKEARKTDDVRAIVKDMLRVFTTSDGKFAMGFSGDIGDGPTTAYDALPPKPWKADMSP
eukprot:scaffold939_cov107-Skeletonema_marinoi.AAC.2